VKWKRTDFENAKVSVLSWQSWNVCDGIRIGSDEEASTLFVLLNIVASVML
jgi:hypothetical protein